MIPQRAPALPAHALSLAARRLRAQGRGCLGRLAQGGDALARRGLVLPWSAAGGMAALSQMLDGALDLPLVAVAWLVCYASYLIDSAHEHADTAVTASARGAYLARRRSATALLGAMAFALAMALAAWRAGPAAALALLAFPASVALYCLPWLPFARGPRCIKDIPYAKTFYTACFWGLQGLWAAACLGHGDSPAALALAFALLATRLWINTTFCDLKDLARDRVQGVRTLALALGTPCLLRLLAAVNLSLPLLLAAGIAGGALLPHALGLALTTVYVHLLLRAARRPQANLERLCNVHADAEWALWPAYVALAALVLA